MSKQTIIRKGKAFAEQISRTVVECAKDLATEVWNTYGDDMPADDLADISKQLGGTVPARVSEWKAFMQAVPFGLAEAVSHYPKVGTLTRVKMFALARALIKEADYSKYKTVAASVEKSSTASRKGAGRKATIGMGLGIIKNAETRKRNEIAFRKDLAALCKKHGIKY